MQQTNRIVVVVERVFVLATTGKHISINLS